MSEGVHEGGCLCGAVRYTMLAAPRGTGNCHCESCRRSAGATPVAWATLRIEDVAFSGEDPVWHNSSEGVERGFCGKCGTALFYRYDGASTIDVTICSLDDPEALPPEKDIWCDDSLSWVRRDPVRPRHPGWPPKSV